LSLKNFNNAMGQESLTRFDQPKPKKNSIKTQSWVGKCDCNSSKPVNKTIIIVSNKVIKACRAKKPIIITKMWIKNSALLLLVMIIFSSCDKKRVFDEYKSVGSAWHKDSIVTFNLPIGLYKTL
jgi:hypothetical protein